jgi:hypothetical protein
MNQRQDRLDVMEPLELGPLIALVEGQHPNGESLDHLTSAVLVSEELTELADELVGHFVELARSGGASWNEVGERLGVSKQAAQQRFVETRSPRRPKGGRFARFNAEARQLTIDAVELAQQGGSREVGTAHLLLALIGDESGVAARAISACGAGLDRIRDAAAASLGPAGPPRRAHLPFSAESKKLLQLALRETVRRKDRHIGAEHILLGMLRDEGSTAALILTEHGVTRSGVEQCFDAVRGDDDL